MKNILKSFFSGSQNQALDKLVKQGDLNILNAFEFVKQKKKDLIAKLSQDDGDHDIQFASIKDVVLNPNCSTRSEMFELDVAKIEFGDYKNPVVEKFLAENVENKKSGVVPGVKNLAKQEQVCKLNNYFIGTEVLNSELPCLIKAKKVNSVLLLTDTAYSRNLRMYKKIVEVLQQQDIPFVEFTNIQNNLERKLIFKIFDFAQKNDVNSVFVVGSDSLIDIGKVVMNKLMNPGIVRLHRVSRKPVINPSFSLFSFPTVVTPDVKVNSKQSLKNLSFFQKYDYFGDIIFLDNAINCSDAVFYFSNIFDELSPDKQMELLHEVFFRLIFNYFDERSSFEERKTLIEDIKIIQWYLRYVSSKNLLNAKDKDIIMKVLAGTVDGNFFINDSNHWTWFHLEASLSHLVNSKKSHGLALFLPSYLEYSAENDSTFRTRLEELGNQLFKSLTYKGAIFNFIKHIEKYQLPIRLLDIKEIDTIDYKFLIYLVKKSSKKLTSFNMTKTIVKNIAVW